MNNKRLHKVLVGFCLSRYYIARVQWLLREDADMLIVGEVAKPACGIRQASHSHSLLESDVTLSLPERYTVMEDGMTIC